LSPSSCGGRASAAVRELLQRPFVIAKVPPELKEFGKRRANFTAGRRGTRLALPTAESGSACHFYVTNVPFRHRKRQRVSTALVTVAASDPPASLERPGGRPRADFLAQLIATSARAPQTRLRRRAAPAEAVAAYGAGARSAMPARHTLSRSL
jgi:hypothetical protein